MNNIYNNAVWESVNHIAAIRNKTCSCMARECGLDANVFNNSKRISSHGQARWLSTKTIAIILLTMHISISEYAKILEHYVEVFKNKEHGAA